MASIEGIGSMIIDRNANNETYKEICKRSINLVTIVDQLSFRLHINILLSGYYFT